MSLVFEYYDLQSFPLRFGGGRIGFSAYEIIHNDPLAYGPLYGDAQLYSVNRYKSILILYRNDNELQKLVDGKLRRHLSEGLDNKKYFLDSMPYSS
jgi:hypothetical protein